MNRITRNISIILRSERLIAQRHLAVLRRQTGFFAAAGLVAGLGIIMLNVAGYQALAGVVSKPAAAVIEAVVNLVLAGLLALLAGKSNVESEIAPMSEARDLALKDLEAEIQGAIDGITRMAKDPPGQIAPRMAGTVAKAVIKNLKS